MRRLRAAFRPLLSFLVAGIAAGSGLAPAARAQSSVRIERNEQLFVVMCALHAAGYEDNVSAAGFHPVRAQLRGSLLGLKGPAAEAVRKFYRERQLADSAATLSRFVSFALVAGPPPKFEYLSRREELPPDVLAVDGFAEVLGEFYREAALEGLWARLEPAYEREIQRLQGPVSQVVLVANSYLREVHRPMVGRAFSIYVEPLIGGKTNSRIYGDRYSIVLNPAAELPLDEIRHTYLHFLLDPLALRYRDPVNARRPLLHFAARAPRLRPEFKDDFPAFFTECLVRAVEMRLRRLPAARVAGAIDEAESEGFVLVRPLFRELAKFEQAEPAMSFYFPDLVAGIDPGEEAGRLEKVAFAAAPVPESPAAEKAEESELESWLRQGEREIAIPDAAAAAATFQRVLEKYPDHPRALYGLAVATVLQGDGESAKEMFQRLILGAAKNDPVILAWSHVYLGRIFDVEQNRQLALSEYRAALAVEGAPEAARVAARRGIEKGFQPRAPASAGPPGF